MPVIQTRLIVGGGKYLPDFGSQMIARYTGGFQEGTWAPWPEPRLTPDGKPNPKVAAP